MANNERVTISLPAELLMQAREASTSNLSQFIADVLQHYFEQRRLAQLEQDLIAAALEKADEDLITANLFRAAEDEIVERYIPADHYEQVAASVAA